MTPENVTQEHVELTDTHCHLDLEHFDTDRDAVTERALAAGVERVLIPGLSVISSRAIVKMVSQASARPSLYAAVGVHPTEAGTWDDSTCRELKELIDSAGRPDSEMKEPGSIAAIGEVGLDYYWNTAPHDLQQRVLWEQLELAAQVELPVILHMREAKDAPTGDCAADLLRLLARWVSELKASGNLLAERPGVLHSFSGTLETAQKAMALGFFIGVSGSVTFTNARRRQEVVTALPLERILTETDAPFLAPHPHRGQRNEPAYVRLIADKIGLLHSCPAEQVTDSVRANALHLFKWK